jgi:hypothetical protein
MKKICSIFFASFVNFVRCHVTDVMESPCDTPVRVASIRFSFLVKFL